MKVHKMKYYLRLNQIKIAANNSLTVNTVLKNIINSITIQNALINSYVLRDHLIRRCGSSSSYPSSQ